MPYLSPSGDFAASRRHWRLWLEHRVGHLWPAGRGKCLTNWSKTLFKNPFESQLHKWWVFSYFSWLCWICLMVKLSNQCWSLTGSIWISRVLQPFGAARLMDLLDPGGRQLRGPELCAADLPEGWGWTAARQFWPNWNVGHVGKTML
jgi:hypothetical protein